MEAVAVNLRLEPYDEYIGRGSKWGNIYTHLPDLAERRGLILVDSREEAVERYDTYLDSRPDLLAALGELEGKRLGCFCKPKACHGDPLARRVNERTRAA